MSNIYYFRLLQTRFSFALRVRDLDEVFLLAYSNCLLHRVFFIHYTLYLRSVGLYIYA